MTYQNAAAIVEQPEQPEKEVPETKNPFEMLGDAFDLYISELAKRGTR